MESAWSSGARFAADERQITADEKQDEKSDDKQEADKGNRRLYMVKAGLDKVIADEKDAEIVKDYRKKMKETFE